MRAVVGTAGHVDHGKTTLTQHLTGIDTDRLAQEKARGISIELGFAWLDLGDEAGRVAIVDVPGHERFVRQMIAGAAGIDLVLLVVAADEGVMPQTREHLDICQLLGVRAGAVVITKADLVDPQWLELVVEDVRDAVAGTFLAEAPVETWAAGDAAARARVLALLARLIADAEARGRLARRSADRPFKLSVDRVFSMRGFGTVVTGTTASGGVAVGDGLLVQPHGLAARVRGIQLHGDAVEAVGPGVRAALNLQGVDRDQVHRGDVLTTPGGLAPTRMIDATFTALERLAGPVADRSKVLVHLGTDQIEATLAFIGAEAAAPGDTVAAQLRLSRPAALLPGEPYVVRGFAVLEGYGKTLGGGRALMPEERRHRRTSDEARAAIEALAGDDPGAAVVAVVGLAGQQGRERARLLVALPWELAVITAAVDDRLAAGALIEAGARLYAAAAVAPLVERAVALLAAHHRERPARAGLRQDELRTRVRGDLAPELFARLVADAVAAGALARRGEHLALVSHQARRSPAQQQAYQAVGEALQAGGLTPPRIQDLPDAVDLSAAAVEEAIVFLVEDGRAVRVTRELIFDAGALSGLEAAMRAHFAIHDTLDTPTFKGMTGASRKWTIPLGEYFDRANLTVRVGDVRRLRKA